LDGGKGRKVRKVEKVEWGIILIIMAAKAGYGVF
jgi:hypothetical protein